MELDYKPQHNRTLSPVRRMMLRTAYATGLCMTAPILLVIALLLPLGYVFELSGDIQNDIGGITFIIAHTISGGLWGRYIAQLTQSQHQLRSTVVAALVFVPTLVINYAIVLLDPFSFESLPTYQKYRMIFLSSVFVVSVVYTGAVGLAVARRRTALRNTLLTGLGSMVVFFVVVLLMDAIGYRVGALRPGLWPPLPPMPTVTLIAILFSACTGGAIFGWCLYHDKVTT